MMDLHQHHRASQGKLILVSNRLPVHVDIKSDNTIQFRSSAGGLATALNGFHKDHAGSLWVGWPGVIPMEHREEVKNRLLTEYGCYPVFLEEDLVEKFYDGFSNNTLWPLFHSFPAYTRYLDSEWEAYKQANDLFAKAILEVASSGDCVWIHDFHIMLLPKILREAMSDLVIGFFLHIPFPSYDIYRLMPWASEITEALLRSDLVGFHTYDYVQNFLAVVRRSLGIDNNLGVIVRDQLVCHVDVFPIGIDFNKFNLSTEHPATQVEIEKIKKRHDGQKIIFAVSRLDYTKGIIESLHAFETLLVTQPQSQKRVVFVLVVVPSRERVKRYASLKKEIDESVGRINSKYGSFEWHPVLYLFQSLTFAELTAYYSRADVGLVIPSRDGMNLVAKEYLATKKDAAGVLVLSEMAGSAKELQEALLVNPNSKREVVEALDYALTMPLDEQMRRNEPMRSRLEEYDTTRWGNMFLERLDKFAQIQLPETSLGPPEIDPSEIIIDHVLGDGSFGTVYQGQCRSKKVAVKKLIKQNLDEKELQDFRREIEILSSIFSPNICLFMGACTAPGNLMIVTELMRSDLERLLQDEGVQLTLFTRIKMGKEIALGMNWLHQNKPPIIHRDLKPSNILVDENLNVKVSDFGLSQIKWTNAKLSAKGEPGSAYWMAPEILMGKDYTEKCDVYSFGIVLWELLTRKEPFEEFDDWDSFLDAVCKQNQRPAIPNGTNPGLKTLIEDCWSADDSARPPFSVIVKRLDTILIDIAVMDLQANNFWKKYFPTRDQVPWKDFINELGRFLKLTSCVNFSSAQRWVSTAPVSELIENHMDLLEGTNLSVNVRCLKSLVADKLKTSQGVILDSEEEVVGLEKFGNVMNWFGPMKIPNSPNEETVLDKIREVLACNWFHGDIPTKEAERMLMGEIPGRFFVRFSTTTPGGFTISKVGKKPTDSATSIRHQRISHSLTDDKYTVHPSNRSYNTLQDLIASETSELQLLHPYPGSKYLSLFVEQDVSGYKEEPSQQPGDKTGI